MPTTPLLDTRGNMSPKGAAELAGTIRNYWIAQGFEGIETRVELEQISSISRHGVWVVRSNMCNGVPPRNAREADIFKHRARLIDRLRDVADGLANA